MKEGKCKMKLYKKFSESKGYQGIDHIGYGLLNASNGCCEGSSTGISIFFCEEYSEPKAHDYQEGFYVVEGTGWAKVGDSEFRIEPDMSYLAPKGVYHCVKKDKNSCDIKLFWFHCKA